MKIREILFAFVLIFTITLTAVLAGPGLPVNPVTATVEYNLSGYKVANNSGVLLFSLEEHSCVWKSDRFDDGFKTCYVEVGIWNTRNLPVVLNLNEQNIRIDRTFQIRGNAIAYTYTPSYAAIIPEIFNISPNSNPQPIIDNPISFVPIPEEVILLPTNSIGVRLQFDVPKYREGSFNFTYLPLNFTLDPQVSACGTLSSPGIYTLAQNIATGSNSCFTLTSDNVIVDANGSRIIRTTHGGTAGIVTGFGNQINNTEFRNGVIENFTNSIASLTNSLIGNDGANITVTNATIESLSTQGANENATENLGAGDGGYIFLRNVTFYSPINATINVLTQGGAASLGLDTTRGKGKDIYIENTFVNVTKIRFNILRGGGSNPLTNDRDGTVTFNFTEGFEAHNTRFTTSTFFLTIQNSSPDGAKIDFLPSITRNADNNISDNIILSKNFVFVNKTILFWLNISANITLNNPGPFSNPILLKNGTLCTTCYNFTPLNSNVVIFNTTLAGGNFSLIDGPDTTNPQVIIHSPQNITYTELPILVNISLSENGSLVFYQVNGTNFTTSTTDNRFYNSSISGFADGSYTLRVFANDTSGNRNDTEFVVFSISTIVPPTPGGGGGPSGPNPTPLTFNATAILEIPFSLKQRVLNLTPREIRTISAIVFCLLLILIAILLFFKKRKKKQ